MMDFHKGRWRLALGRLVNLRYINRWIIFSADLFVSLSVSLLGVLGMFSILHIRIGESDVLKVGLSSFVGSIVSFLLFKAYHGVIRHSTLRGLWRIGGAAIGKSLLMFLLLWLLKARFSPSIYWLGGIMDSTLTIVMLVTLRVFVINVYNSVLLQLGKKRKRVLVFGTEEESVMIATSANRQVFMQNYSIMGFLSFGNSKKSIRIAELPVYQIENVEDLYRLIPRNSLDGVLFPNIKVAHQERDRLIRYCEQASLKPLVVPDMEEVHEGGMKRSVREIRIEDLLGREEISINLGEIGLLLKDKTILVTGAVLLFVTTKGKGKEWFAKAGKRLLSLFLSVLLGLPVVFTATRTIPAVVNDPFIYDIEVFIESIERGEEPDSRRYMTVARFVAAFNMRILGMDEKSAMIFGSDDPGYISMMKEDYRFVASADGMAGINKQEGDPMFDTSDISNGRFDIYRSYWENLNWTGHEVMSVDGKIMHAHNIYLQTAYDNGIPAGIMLAAVNIASVVFACIFYKRKRIACAELPLAVMTAFLVAGIVEWSFHPCNPFGFIWLLTMAPLLFDRNGKKAEQK